MSTSVSVIFHKVAVRWALVGTALADINNLMTQLTTKCKGLDLYDLEQIVSQGRYLYVKPQATIVGVTTLFLSYKSTGWFAEIHDVVVDNQFRGQGIGRALMEQAIASARQGEAEYIELTSNPSRKAANKLYRSLGFVRIGRANRTKKGGSGTNLYRLVL